MIRKTKKKWKLRLWILTACFIVAFSILIGRAFQLQILSGKMYKPLANKQHITALQLQPDRGLILDRNGEKLAASVSLESVCADPSKVADPKTAAARLCRITGANYNTVLERLTGSKNFCWIARMISPAEAEAVQSLKIEGIFLIREPKRFYPNQNLAGSLLGFVGIDSTGLEGIESKYDSYLKREPEKVVWGRDARGNLLFLKDSLIMDKADQNYNILLTIDSRIQYLVEAQLKRAVDDKMARGGIAVALDPRTGEVLAMAQDPGLNPNTFSKSGAEFRKNRAISDSFDPGSTFKPFVVAAALEEGLIREKDRIFCENGAYPVANRVIHEAQKKKHGSLTVREIIKYSSNIGCAKIGQRLGRERFHKYVRDFGFGAKTGIDLPGESTGILRPASRWTTVDTAAISFGQGISVTAIQLVSALSAIANQGVLMRPFVVKGLVDQDGRLVREFKPIAVRQVVSARTAQKMTSILTDVVSADDGTGKNARIVNVSVAGKTGTSQKFDFSIHKYSSERVRTSFMGFFPAEDPRIAIFVMLDEPKRDKWGGVAAAPVFRSIGEQILRCYEGIPGEVVEPKIEDEGADQNIRLVDMAVSDGIEDTTSMPDFRGLSVKNVLKLARERGIALSVIGSGWAVRQAPSPGVPLSGNAACTVFFSAGK
ncbi:MAG: penicillin-binding protein [Syntrophales bacterium]|nr:penicillin-binding protein [Syntrophales bacterium]MDD5532765.1 penicillin-binding protein [Syntrophales bacterium]